MLASMERTENLTIDFGSQRGRSFAPEVLPDWTPAPAAPGPTLRDYPAGRGNTGRAITLESLKVGERLNPVTRVQLEDKMGVLPEDCSRPIIQSNGRSRIPVGF